MVETIENTGEVWTDPAIDAESGIAIIGMSGRFPGAPNVEELWRMVCEGRDAFSLHTPDTLEDAFTDEERAASNFVPARPHLENVDFFDADFFGMFPREAALTDPQHRVFLEICWEALENAGYDPKNSPGMTGVFAGSSMPTYLINNVLGDRAKAEEFTSSYQIGCFQQLVGALNDALATRVAYKFGLKGPAFTLQSACSTSLLAVSQACQSLLTYGCDMALAGGVSITIPQRRGYFYQEGGMASADGKCRPFDAAATGTVFASGAGVVVLKRLDNALQDGDRIYAVIRGCGVNNDGSDKIGFTAPSVEGQADAIATALANAGFDPATIGYVECHGTATPLGDPIEFGGLVGAFEGSSWRDGACALGSLKGNTGHMDAAAGVSGLIKAALSIYHSKIPGMANYRSPNPRIALETSPFRIPAATQDWPRIEGPRRAGVSSFGVGGTNVHVVLEQVEPVVGADEPKTARPYLLPLAARNEAALADMRAGLARHLAGHSDIPLAQAAHTLQNGRHAFSVRACVAASTREEAIERLSAERLPSAKAGDAQPPVVFMFPGQGAQYVGMAAGLYQSELAFARWIDRGAELLKPSLQTDLRDYLCHAGAATQAMAEELRETRIAQPCLYLVEYALAHLWMSRGLTPDAMIGHSVGEFVAATLANVMSFEEGLKLVAARGRLMQNQPHGAMVSVRADAATVATHLRDGVEIAAINAPKLCVVSGTFEAMDAVCASFEKAGVAFSRLHTSHAFHSAMMEEAADGLRDETAKVTYGSATIPYISCVTGEWQADAMGTSPEYWARHCRDAVQFAKGLQTLCQDRKPILLEVGPGRALSVFASQTIAKDGIAAIIQSLPEHDRAAFAADTLAEAHGKLWMNGCALEWPELPEAARKRVPLPAYPFQRQRHWIDAPPSARRGGVQANTQPRQQPATEAAPAIPANQLSPKESVPMNVMAPLPAASRIPALETSLLALLADMSGEELDADAKRATFLELGFDSLFIGQFAQKIEKEYKVKLSFRELLSNIPRVADLASHLDKELPPEPAQPVAVLIAQVPTSASEPVAPAASLTPVMAMPAAPVSAAPLPAQMPVPMGAAPASAVESILQSQLQVAQSLFAQQIQMLQGLGANVAMSAQPAAVAQALSAAQPVATAPLPVRSAAAAPAKPAEETEIGTDRIKLYRPGAKGLANDMTPQKQAFIADLIRAYEAKAPASKAYADANRKRLADPRTASGFRAEWKEIVFPIVSDRSKGARIWDTDGNEYIDLVNGFGQTAFGHAPDFVIEAMKEQMEKGFAIGPQTPLAGEVASMIAEMTGHERVTFCNTGSEAVMAAMRVARAVTGRERVAVFANDYHGQFDEVLVKGRNRSGNPIALPIAPGIPNGSVSNMTVLKYGEQESLDWIAANAQDIAAVIVEPIQSRHPELQPVEFVRSLRDIATREEFALVFDEVVTGFRVDPGGMQAVWGIKGDMATYGKIIGGGMPIGVLAGSARFMDALDGGQWNYGDDSVPMTAPTFFAGTFVRHPVVLAAARAIVAHIKGDGAALYGRVASRTEALVAEIRKDLAARGIHNAVHGYKSWFAAHFSNDDPLGSLMYQQLRLRGIHIQEGYPCFLTTEHSETDFQAIAAAFRDSADALQAAGILAGTGGHVEAAAATPRPAPAQVARPQSAPLTEAQTEIWLAAQAGDEASCAFNESFTLTLEGAFDEAAFRKALDTVMARHDAFHIRFARSGDRFEFIEDFRLSLPLVDLSGESDAETRLKALIEAEARNAFDLVDGPLARAHLVRMAPDRHLLVFTAHHIVCDGWSINILIEELSAAYDAAKQNRDTGFEPAMSFATYSTEFAPRADLGTTEQFWLSQFPDIPELPEMPLDRPRPERRSFAGGTCTGHVGKDVYKALKKAGGRSGATLFSTLLAALQVMIARLSGSNDIVIAVPSAGQSLLDGRILAGHCVNLLPLRQTVDAAMPFEEHLKATQQHVLEAFEHQDYTYGTLVRKLGIKRDPSRLPLTEIQFNLERVGANSGFSGLRTAVEPNGKAFSNFDMFFNMIEREDGIRIDVDYNAEVFDASTIERWIGHFATLAEALAASMTRPIGELPLLSEAQKNWLADELNASAASYEKNTFVFTLFAQKAHETPKAIAAEHDGKRISYGELEARSNQLARHIAATVGEPGQRIALLMNRSIDMLVALLAIMKSGHAYVPMDPSVPAARLQRKLEVARVAGIICDSDACAALAGGDHAVIRTDNDQAAISARSKAALKTLPTDPSAPAYIIFTSGSTGTPKGVEVPHRALVNFLVSMAREPGFTANDTVLAVTTVSFDIAGLELYLPLICGGRVVIADRSQVQDGFALVRLAQETKATVIQATPTLWQILVEAGLPEDRGLKMLCGGEPMPRELARELLRRGGELWNMYGPTETTIWSSVARIEDAERPITIGRPIANTDLHIVDGADRIAPVGVTGELIIGGDGLARGYFGRDDLTVKAFADLDPAGTGHARRFYRTGDVGKRLADGSLQLLGRRDSQIKLRGFRIELGDIEAVISKADGVRQCAVSAPQNKKGDRQLVCYIVPNREGVELPSAELAQHAKNHLPSHMIPGFWVSVSELPQTSNGKLDRKNLEQRGLPQREKAIVRIQPRTDMEKKLSRIWREVLNLEEFGVEDNLYALGADSLSIFRLAARMMDSGLPLEAKHLLRHPSIAELAIFAETQAGTAHNSNGVAVPSLRDFRNGARRRPEAVA